MSFPRRFSVTDRSHSIEKKILNHERLDGDDGLYLLREAPLNWLGRLSMVVRNRLHPEK